MIVLRYKYLQKPLEESSLPTLIQYINRWPEEQRNKFAVTVGLLMSQGLATAAPLVNLSRDQLVKDGVCSDLGLPTSRFLMH